ncbi:ArnT family glycosyltransferase [Planctomyces sp. SH-PL62]|uniref:ArnT family glycosyltransferase n=1 Tax=Planctomyces sp. SH-PL62 TaxID=1636152 RepID=UPI00078CA156|nr:glycosyltransferase family 39 protein [Planctomyces sp. SH-PL62]AMV40046.1 Undecaprenyl phosphate-alpha-4-amino-4-deoxy-L-arabinose arabinosyl transferase [Planctomyces sp. SH-PL62]
MGQDAPERDATTASPPPKDGRRPAWIEPLALVAVCLALFLAGNARTGLWDRDEPRNAVAVHEMRGSGDWLFPTFNGEPRHHKPILAYWFMGAATAILGEGPAGMRLHSALAGTGTCLLVWMLGRRILGARAGFLAALMLAVSPIMVAESKLATTDALLTFWLTACQLCLWELARRGSRRIALTFWVLLALAMLTKGPVGPALLAVTAAFAWWWGCPVVEVWRRLEWRRGLLAFALLSGPWYVLMLVATRGDFVEVAVKQQFLQRLATGMEEHGAIPGYYGLMSTALFFPWSCLVPMGLLAAWRRRKVDPNLAYLVAWIVGPMILLECVQTKLIHYYLPAYPACALLAAWVVKGVDRQAVTLRRWPLGRLAQGMIAGIGVTAGVGMAAASAIAPAGLGLPLVACGLVVGLGTAASLLQLHRGETWRGAYGLAATVGLMMLLVSGWLIPRAEPLRVSRIVGERLAALKAETGLDPLLMQYQEPGVVYAYGRPIALTREASTLRERLDRQEAMITAVTPEEVVEFEKKFGVEFTRIEDVAGFNAAKGKAYRLHLAVVRKAKAPESTATGAVGEQPLVK